MYKTNNPLGSFDPRDLMDNSEALDNFVNGSENAYPDRLGVERRSLAGLQADVEGLGAELGQEIDDVVTTLGPARHTTLGDAMRKAQSGATVVVSCYGDSITYGQDTSADGQATQINGATQTRSRFPYPDCLNESLGFAGFVRTVNNYGFPGDTCVRGLERWARSTSSWTACRS